MVGFSWRGGVLSGMRIVIIGGGASGVLLAVNLLRARPRGVEVVLVERRPDLGVGFAYSTRDPAHLLNVRASNMSAFPSEPDHFRAWLVAEGKLASATTAGGEFASRADFGSYVTGLLAPHLEGPEESRALHVVRGACVAIERDGHGITVHIEDGRSVRGDRLVLAMGNEVRSADLPGLASPWTSDLVEDARTASDVAVLGAGLSMVDTVISLLRAGFRGSITALSRHGLLSETHAAVTHWPLDPASVPVAQGPVECLRWARAEITRAEAAGADWRSVIDALRPYTQALWQGFTVAQKRSFFAHLRPYWDIRRHRLAPSIGAEIADARARGQLRLVAGAFLGAEPLGDKFTFAWRPRKSMARESVVVDRAYNCTGLALDPAKSASPLMRAMVAAGLIRSDALGLGLDVDARCALIERDGRVDGRLFAIGPQTRSRFWEIIAIPDIRVQAVSLAQELLSAVTR